MTAPKASDSALTLAQAINQSIDVLVDVERFTSDFTGQAKKQMDYLFAKTLSTYMGIKDNLDDGADPTLRVHAAGGYLRDVAQVLKDQQAGLGYRLHGKKLESYSQHMLSGSLFPSSEPIDADSLASMASKYKAA